MAVKSSFVACFLQFVFALSYEDNNGQPWAVSFNVILNGYTWLTESTIEALGGLVRDVNQMRVALV